LISSQETLEVSVQCQKMAGLGTVEHALSGGAGDGSANLEELLESERIGGGCSIRAVAINEEHESAL